MSRNVRTQIELIPLEGLPLLHPGDDLAAVITAAVENNGISPSDGDVLVLAQKVVSKAEGRYLDIADITPSSQAMQLAVEVGKDARFVEAVLQESTRVVRSAPGVLIVEHRLGFIMANAGIDRSNIDPGVGQEPVLLLPADPDASASRIMLRLKDRFGRKIAVIINDSFGRPWRQGTVGVALGAAGLPSLRDLRGRPDLYGRALRVTDSAFADEIAAAASLVMGQADESRPAVLVRGLVWPEADVPASGLIRPPQQDLFR